MREVGPLVRYPGTTSAGDVVSLTNNGHPRGDAWPGLSLLRNAKEHADLAGRIDELKLQGVDFNICNVTVTRGSISITEELYDASEADIVPSGVAEIAHLQQQGFIYLRP